MSTKSELISKLEALLDEGSIESISEQVELIKSNFEELRENEERAKAEALEQAAESTEAEESSSEKDDNSETPAAVEENQPIENAQDLSEEDKQFKALVDGYNSKVNELRKARIEEEKANLAKKESILQQLDELIKQEENIGSAFNRFNELQEEWKGIGQIPQQNYRDVQKAYSDKLDEFFYNIRIYKELREHDLKKNAGLKEALGADMEALAKSDTIKEMELKVREYQEQWKEIGPVVKEDWERIADRFWAATRAVYEKIGEHYQAKRDQQAKNLEAKQSLVNEVKDIVSQLGEESAKDWKNLTDKVLKKQADWKKVGFASKKDNERIWQEFRNECDQFFNKKAEYFSGIREVHDKAKEAKEAIIAKAEELKDSTQWRETAETLKKLQSEWKTAGFAGNRHENRLWGKFRAACDHFFEARKAQFAEQNEAEKANLANKKALLEEMESFSLSGNKGQDLGKLKEFSTRWNDIGRIPPGPAKKMIPKYRELMDKFYGKLDISRAEKNAARVQGKANAIKKSKDPRKQFEHEKRQLNRKIDFLRKDILQYEENLGMFNFTSASGEAMKKDIEKKIERAEREITSIREQQKQLSKMMKEAESNNAPEGENPSENDSPENNASE